MKGLILSLCDFTGNWSRPYADAGYEVVTVDLQRGEDVRLLKFRPGQVRGILAAPPCTHFARSGALHWKAKGEAKLLEGLAIVDACLRAVAIYRPEWWALENPVGRLQDYIGPPKWRFDPCDFGDAYTKRTWLWGHFTPPMPLFSAQARRAVEPATFGSRVGGRDRTTMLGSRNKVARSTTPEGFARAFFEANP